MQKIAAFWRPPARTSLTTFAWLASAPLLLAVLYFYPLSQILRVSFTEPKFGLGNYAALLADPAIRRVFATTLRISAITTVISVALGYIVAYAMLRGAGWRRQIMLVCVLVPFWISVLVRAFAWVALLRTSGLINTILVDLNIISEPLDLLYSETAVIIGMVHYMVPLAVLTLYAQMSGIDRRLLTAAQGLGAGQWYAFRRVFLPLTLPGIVAAGLLIFINALGFYIVPALLGGGKTLMLAEYISLLISQTVNWGQGTAMASALVLVILCLVFLLSRIVDLRRTFGAQ